MQPPSSFSKRLVLARRVAVVFGAFSLAAPWCVYAAEPPKIRINEVLYDAVGADSGHEWIELYNASDETTDLRGWRLERAGTQFASVFTFSDGVTIAPGGFLLVGESLVEGADVSAALVLQNGGSATDGIRLVADDGEVVDVLLYDAPNTNNLPNETGIPGASFAPDVSEGHSLARVPDGSDTDASGADFVDSSAPTPRAANASSGTPTPVPSPSLRPTPTGIVVNEALPNPIGNDADGEFIELFNTTGGDLDLGGARLDDADGGSSPHTIPDGTIIAAGGYLSFSRSKTGIALNNEGDAARLLAADLSLVHSLTYGKAPREGASWARKADGSADWTMSPTAGASNTFTPLQVAEKKEGATGTATPSPRASLSTQGRTGTTSTPSPKPPRSVAGLKVEGRIKGTAATKGQASGGQRVSASTRSVPGTITQNQDAVLENREESVAADILEAAGSTDTPASPSGSEPPAAAPPSPRIPLPAILAWAAAGILGVSRLLIRKS